MITVGVVIPTLNNLEGAYKALASIKGSYKIFWIPIILDNWRENRSVAESWNYGIEIAAMYECNYVLVINDDILFSPWTLSGLVNAFENKTDENIVMVTGQNWRDTILNPEDIFNIDIPSYRYHNYNYNPDFACFLARPDIIDIIGKFDENFKLAYFEDNDYHRRIKLLGYEAISTEWAPYFHFGSQTQNKFLEQNGHGVVTPDQYNKNQQYYVDKWGGPPMYESYSNPYNDERMSPAQWKLFQ